MAVVEVIKYNGSPEVFAWKFPSEELGTWTQLIVNESQEAILVKSGKALDVFSSGRHTLSTANIPILNNIINLPFGGRSPFTAEVWYINKVHSLDIKWGTASPIQLQDPKYGVFIPVRSFGQFGIRITNSKKFLIKLVGTLPTIDKKTLNEFFRGLYLTKVKDSISSYLIHRKVGILEINAYLDEISAFMEERIKPVLEEYGIGLINFFVNDISVPEDDPAVIKLKDALSKRAEMDIVGYSYQQERSFDTLEGAATNPGSASAGLMGAGLGLGMGVGMGGAFGQEFRGISENFSTQTQSQKLCPRCGNAVKNEKAFCSDCGCDLTAQDTQHKLVKCDKCGTPLDPKKKFCAECGDPYNPCPNCGSDISENLAQCPDCGYILPTPCSNCGSAIPNGVKFCPECGTSQRKQCPTCQTEFQGKPKFCAQCGEKL